VPAMQPGRPLRDAVEIAHASGYFRQSGDDALDALYDHDREAWIDGYLARYDQRFRVFERRNPDGRWFKAIDTRADDGSYVGVRVDITELKAREAELEEAQRKAVLADRAKSEFLANMSHEIRTPMNGVLGMAELLAKSELDTKQQTFTDIIMKSGNALLTIINDILDFSKIDAVQMVLDPAPFDLAEAIEDVATLMSTRAKEKDIEVIVRVQAGLPKRFVGDVGRIRQIVTNLVGNAVKFTDAGHVLIDVAGEEMPDAAMRLTVSVTDTGIGIPRDKLALVFDKFAQVDASSTRRHEGTGLGLAITSSLVAMMGGTVDVSSEENVGSTFRFAIELPLAEQKREPKPLPLDVSGARILVIDDNPVNRSILQEQMDSWGFDACAADSGAEGLAVLSAAARMGIEVDCVVLDYQMPAMTGADVAERMRASADMAAVPIVMLTSVDQSLTIARATRLGIDAHLIKPARSSALLEAVVAAIQKRRSGAEVVVVEEPAAPARPAPVAAPQRLRSGDDHRVDILVAEDNEVNQLVFTQILSETGYSFEIVSNGQLAVEAHRRMNPRMILMDVSMPRLNGLEATGRIRDAEQSTGAHVPIVGVTAHALKGDRERCLEAGMDDYLPKPISPRALLAKIEQWAGNATASGEAMAAMMS
jgi:signal transduction histidine kinase/CheY-like chemotaxis protein